jgi:hypothetical protein
VKLLFAAAILLGILLVAFGSPVATQTPVRDHYFEAPKMILPMSFAHEDHIPVNCIDCHHNYVDDTGGGLCMNCHVTDQQVWPLFEQQFHDLCRGCHAEKAALGEAGGPPRQCIGCHLGDDLP